MYRDSTSARRRRGARAERWGHAAEDSVARLYQARGAEILARRWRGSGQGAGQAAGQERGPEGAAEIDLIVREGAAIVFVEVKARRGRAAARQAMAPAQWRRLARAAEAYMGQTALGDRDMRIDLAAVDGLGAIDLIENVSMDLAA